MDENTAPAEMIAAARDPRTDGEYLRRLAYYYPDLAPDVARHPNAYPALLEWLAQLDDPAVNAALAQRAQASQASAPSMDVADVAANATPASVTQPTGLDEAPAQPTAEPAAGEPTAEVPAAQTPAAHASPTDPQQTAVFQVPVETQPATTEPPVTESAAVESPAADATAEIPAMYAPQSPVDEAPLVAQPVAAEPTTAGPAAVTPEADLAVPAAASAQLDPATKAAKKKSSTAFTVTVTVLSFLTVLLIAAIVLVMTGVIQVPGGSTAAPQSAPAPATSAGGSSTPNTADSTSAAEASPQASATTARPKYPAPADAKQAVGFTTPSGNIACQLDDSSAFCTIKETEWTGTEGSCQGPETMYVDNMQAGLNCDGFAAQGGDALPYNASVVNGDMACRGTLDGVTCWSTKTGASFAVAKRGYLSGSEGPIEPTDIP